jgi:hypothetical protein
MMQQALPLGILDDPTLSLDDLHARASRGEPPASAEEYLWRVRHEFSSLPEIVEATHIDARAYDAKQTKYMPAQPALPQTPPGREAGREWVEGVLCNFLDVRQGLSVMEEGGVGKERRVKVPPLKEEKWWKRFFFGSGGEEGGEEGGQQQQQQRQEGGGEEEEGGGEGNDFQGPTPPLTSLVLQFDQVGMCLCVCV